MGLQSSLAQIHHEMYQTIFDYKKEFRFYHGHLKKNKCKKILEIGCGSGNLAEKFLDEGYDYTGLDVSKEMLKIAKQLTPQAKFIQGDMRNLKLKEDFDAIIITGRSFTYMTDNNDIVKALKSIHKHLKKKGVLIFDNFDAEKIIDGKEKEYTETAKYEGREYKRVSSKTLSLKNGWTEEWSAIHYVTENGKTKVVKNRSYVRSFLKDELNLFLKLTGFKTIKIIKKNLSLVCIAQKK